MPDNMTDFFNLDTIKDTYFIQAEGLFKKSVQKEMFKQMIILIDEHEYSDHYILSQGEISRSVFKPIIEINAWVKFFKTKEEYQEFIQRYDPFKK